MNHHHCPDCRWSGLAPDDVAIVFHQCRPPRSHRRRRYQIPPVRDTRDDLTTDLGMALEAAVGGEEAWYTDDEEEQ